MNEEDKELEIKKTQSVVENDLLKFIENMQMSCFFRVCVETKDA